MLGFVIPASQEKPSTPRFRVEVDAVRVDVLVTRRGRPVGGLVAADFQLLDNGIPQVVSSVSLEALPINVVLVLDVSQSVAGSRLSSLVSAGRAAVDALRPTDRVGLLTFSESVAERVQATADHERLRNSLNAISAGGTTSLYDAAYAGLLLGHVADARTLVLLFSDGIDTSSWLQPHAVVDAGGHSDAVVYAVVARPFDVRDAVNDSLPGADRSRASETIQQTQGPELLEYRRSDDNTRSTSAVSFLQRLADATGGRVLDADDRHLAGSFASLVKEFQNRYLLTYVPTGVAQMGWHRIEVRIGRGAADIQARRGYWR